MKGLRLKYFELLVGSKMDYNGTPRGIYDIYTTFTEFKYDVGQFILCPITNVYSLYCKGYCLGFTEDQLKEVFRILKHLNKQLEEQKNDRLSGV